MPKIKPVMAWGCVILGDLEMRSLGATRNESAKWLDSMRRIAATDDETSYLDDLNGARIVRVRISVVPPKRKVKK